MTISLPRLNRTNQILLGLLALQLTVALILFVAGTSVSATPSGPLISGFAPDTVTQITIRDSQDVELVLAKGEDGRWKLPDAGDYPVRAQPVTDLLDAMKAMDTSRLVAQNVSSQPRLKVADSAYERYVEITQGDDKTVLYVGTSGSGNGVHVRLGSQNEVYLVTGLSLFQVSTRAASWVNPVYFSVPQQDIVAVTVQNANGVFDLQKQGDTWTLADLADGETFNADSISTMLNHVSSFSLDTPLGTQDEDRFGLATPLATITIQTHHEPEPTATPEATGTAEAAGGLFDVPQLSATQEAAEPAPPDQTFTIQIGAKLDDTGYVAKASNSDYYVKIGNGVANTFLNLTRESLLVQPPTPTPATN